MRLIFGMILGIVLTVGGAFLHDNWPVTGATAPAAGEPPPAVTEQRAMVNWDVVGENWRRVRLQVREAWTTLSHKINS